MRPIYPQPFFTEQDLHNLLATRQFAFADCFTFRMLDGMVLRFTTAISDVRVIPIDDPSPNRVTFTSRGMKVSGLKLTVGVGVEVDEQELKLDYDAKMTYLGQPVSAAIARGRMDGATIRRDRYFTDRLGRAWIAGVPMFLGKLSTVDSVGRSEAIIKVKSDLVLLNIQMPRKLFQPTCTRTLFDPQCTLNKLDYETVGVLAAGSTPTELLWAGANEGMRFGTVNINDAQAVTQIRTINDVVPGQALILASPLDFNPIAGTNIKAYPGCVRTYGRCGDFNNQENFQGFEFVPTAETAY